MGPRAAVWLVLSLAFVLATLPFVNERILIVGPRRGVKGLAWRWLELLIGFAITVAVGFVLEAKLGQRQAQGWQFYAAFGCLFVTFAFPGFTWRYLRKRR